MVKFHIREFEISITFGFLLVLSLLSLTNSPSLGFIAVSSCIIHELGHSFAAIILNVKIKSLTLWAGGILMQRESRILSIGSELAVLICGPLFNLIFSALYAIYGITDASVINLTLALFNLLPYSSLDGGCIIKGLLERKNLNCNFIQKATAVSFGAIIMALLYFTKTRNITAIATIILLTANELITD